MVANISTLKAENPEVGSSRVIFSFVLGLEVPGFRLAGGSEEMGSHGHCEGMTHGHCEDTAASSLVALHDGSLLFQ